MSKIAFCFPGQGSQRVGMGRDMAREFPEAAAVFDEASEEVDFDLRKVCFDGPIDRLSETDITQPALVTASLAALRAVQGRLGLSEDKVVTNVDRFGNTSAASIPICLDEAHADGRIKAGDVVLMTGFGGGLSWGSCVMEWTLPQKEAR